MTKKDSSQEQNRRASKRLERVCRERSLLVFVRGSVIEHLRRRVPYTGCTGAGVRRPYIATVVSYAGMMTAALIEVMPGCVITVDDIGDCMRFTVKAKACQ